MAEKFKWKGLDKLFKRFKERPRKVAEGVKGALFEEVNELATEAKLLVPVKEGILKSSGFASNPEKKKGEDSFSAEVGFGGPAGSGNQGDTNKEDVGYAVRVHEDLTSHHTVGQAKYLEQPFNQRLPTMAERLARRIKDRLGGG